MRRPESDPPRPYTDLLEMAEGKGWTSHLEVGRDGWTLDIREGDDLVARATSTKGPPDCWAELGLMGSVAISRSGRA